MFWEKNGLQKTSSRPQEKSGFFSNEFLKGFPLTDFDAPLTQSSEYRGCSPLKLVTIGGSVTKSLLSEAAALFLHLRLRLGHVRQSIFFT